jgi:predicted nucleic acid-binding protein
MPSIDALIASTAMAKNLIIITHNAKDMKHSRAQILDPWD